MSPLERLRSASALLAALLFLGCVPGLRPAPTPMPSQVLEASGSPCAVVFLPGVLDSPRDFDRKGFGTAVRDAGLDLHAVAADAHLRYYRKKTVIDRLRQDVVEPLRADGRRVWLVGISLGGVGSLIYGRDHGDEIEGLVILAPFLGEEELIEEIQAAGGPLAWTPPEVIAEDDIGPKLWSWIQEWHAQPVGDRPEIYLGFGESDDFAPAGEMLAELLPEGHTFRHPGGHDWKAWLPLWRDVLASGAFGGCSG